MVPIAAAPFSCCTATDRRCCRQMNNLASAVTCMRRWSSSFRKSGVSDRKKPASRLNDPRSEGVALVEG